ncbi:MAG: hypothetical protein NC417_01135 [Candidatus Gastranaerophilales bacterium]|nr:hypothetical protein [Candidatus Gastranaerophilales bacterium]
MEIRVNVKAVGKRKNSVKPVIYEIGSAPSTVRELILAVTETGVLEYNRRQESSELLQCLTGEEIEDRAAEGKISFGVNYGEKRADIKQAQENAVQCFLDGIYRIFLDDVPLTSLDEEICVSEESVFTFVRLTMLAGRMWF